MQATLSPQHDEQQWVLQLGYFANLDNALSFKQQLADTEYEVQVVATGLPGEQRYRVIIGEAYDQADLTGLRTEIERKTGNQAIIVPSPLKDQVAEEIFDQPKLRYRMAQATPFTVAGNSATRSTSGYDPMLNRSPQEEVASSIGFTAAGMQVIPTVGLSIGYDDNVTLAHDFEISSMFYLISPAIRIELPSDHSVLSLIGAMEIVRYQDSPIDDLDYWYLRGEWVWDISTRQDINLFAQYSDGADKRGEGRRQGNTGLIPFERDKWNRWDYGGVWDYGALGARGRLTLMAGASDLTYNNNQGDGDIVGTRALDRDWQFFGGTLYWRVAPKTSLLLDYLYTDINYKLATDSDSTEESWMVGVTWDATARTSGTLQYGNLTKDFDDPTKNDYDGPTWVASVSWRPRTYSVFTLTGTRNTQEPDGRGDYVLRQDVSLAWLHDWATRFGTIVDVGFGTDDYRPTDRKDDLFYWSVAARYNFNQHFRLGASIAGYDRSSEVREFDYNQMIYMLTFEATY